ncbi:hypothetical protein [Nitrosopumilus sp. S4]
MNNAQCKKCLRNFKEKEIYTIQQFQYRKNPTYKWSLDYFKNIGIDEWDSLCEKCINELGEKSLDFWEKSQI